MLFFVPNSKVKNILLQDLIVESNIGNIEPSVSLFDPNISSELDLEKYRSVYLCSNMTYL